MGDADPTAPVAGPNSNVCREPTIQDLVRVCRALNENKARYIVIGGFAVRDAGYARNTMDLDLLIELSPENEARVFKALEILPDKAVQELSPGDVAKFGVIRVADEILVDLMAASCGIPYSEAAASVIEREIEGVRIPIASPELLLRMKQTVREKDAADRIFLANLLARRSEEHSGRPGRTGGILATLAKWLRG